MKDKGIHFLARCLRRGGEDADDEEDKEREDKEKKEKEKKQREREEAAAKVELERDLNLSQQATKVVMKTKEEHMRNSIKVPLSSIKCPLKHLCLNMNKFSDLASANVLASLRHNEIMTSLAMAGCNVADESVTALCSLLENNSTLTHLDLSCNPINAVSTFIVFSWS